MIRTSMAFWVIIKTYPSGKKQNKHCWKTNRPSGRCLKKAPSGWLIMPWSMIGRENRSTTVFWRQIKAIRNSPASIQPENWLQRHFPGLRIMPLIGLAHLAMWPKPVRKSGSSSIYNPMTAGTIVWVDEDVKFIQKPFALKDMAVKLREVLEQK